MLIDCFYFNDQLDILEIRLNELYSSVDKFVFFECNKYLGNFQDKEYLYEKQKERFKKHIELALKLKKTLVIHCREAHDDMLAVLSAYSHELAHIPVVMHFFTGSGELAQKYLDLGCYLSFPGPVTYTDMYDDSIRICPLDNMLIETDAPFAAPTPYRSKRNEPAYVEYVAQKVAQIKGISVDAVMEHTVANAKKVFKLQQS